MAEGEPAAERTRSSLRVARVLGRGFALHLKMMMRSSFDGLLGVLWPLFFATIAFLMFRLERAVSRSSSRRSGPR